MLRQMVFVAALVVVSAGVAFAVDDPRDEPPVVPQTPVRDHSAFFNGAGSGDVPVRRMPGTTVRVERGDRDDDHGHDHDHDHGWHGHWRGPRYHGTYWNYGPRSVWVPGHYEWRTQQVWVEPTWTEEWVPPVYQYGYEGSRQIRILVREGYYRKVQIPGHYEQRQVQVWVEGYWRYY